MNRRLSALFLVTAAVALLPACGSESTPSSSAERAEARPATSVRDLSSLLALRARFNDDRGSTRLVLLLSPT